jgi:hypothetical protein
MAMLTRYNGLRVKTPDAGKVGTVIGGYILRQEVGKPIAYLLVVWNHEHALLMLADDKLGVADAAFPSSLCMDADDAEMLANMEGQVGG